MVLAAADAVPLHVAVGVVVGDVIQMAMQAFGDGLEPGFPHRAVHGARQLAGVGDLCIVHEARMPMHAAALDNGAQRARHRIIARADALRAHALLARPDTTADGLPALGLGGGGVVEDELAEHVGFTERSI